MSSPAPARPRWSTPRTTGGRSSPASPSPAPRAATSWPAWCSCRRGAARRAAAVLGLADPVPAQCRGGGRRLVDPADPAREPGLRGGAGAPRGAQGAVEGAVPGYTPDVLKIVFAALASVNSTIFGNFALAYGVTTMGMSAHHVPLVVHPGQLPRPVHHSGVGGCSADRIGRKPVFMIGMAGVAAWSGRSSGRSVRGTSPLLFVIGILMSGIVYSGYGGVGVRAVQRAVRHQGPDVRRGGRHPVRFCARRFRPGHRRRCWPGPRWRVGCRSRSSPAPPPRSRPSPR